MTILAQGAINLVAQFIKIVLKILVLHLQNRAKFFLDDMGVKKLKTTYNNKKLIFKIKQYMVEQIENLDKILTDLEQVGVIIAGTKS